MAEHSDPSEEESQYATSGKGLRVGQEDLSDLDPL
jgi:hypothetical protein